MTAMTTPKRDFLVSVRPEYAEKIVEGVKTVELRRRFSDDVEAGAMIFIYSTSPTRAVIGSASIGSVQRLELEDLWFKFGKAACIERDAFDTYFAGREHGYAILLEDVKPVSPSVGAADLHEQFGFVAPQSFMYLKQEYYHLLGHERVQTPN